ncbi:MAG: ParB N-terminal domain-containing protein [Candidatus Promineifilaceae bacterium]
MAKKKTGLSSTLFQGIDPYGQQAVTIPDVDTVATYKLSNILPDPDQPRQLLSLDYLKALWAGQWDAEEALNAWLTAAEANRGEMRKVSRLRELADSIAQHGLISPITVRFPEPDEEIPIGIHHIIVTGERRFWAHVLLALEGRQIQQGSELRSPQEIQTVPSAPGILVRAHQLIENLQREDINAIEKAWGLWALRYELSGVNYRSPFISGKTQETPEKWWVAEDEENESAALVPWATVCQAIGMSNRYRIYLTNTLQLTPEAQALIQQYDLAEMVIRPIVQKLRPHPDLQLQALQQVIAWQEENTQETGERRDITRSTEWLVEHLLQKKLASPSTSASQQRHLARPLPTARSFHQGVQRTLRLLQPVDEKGLRQLAQQVAKSRDVALVLEEVAVLQQKLGHLLAHIKAEQKTR